MERPHLIGVAGSVNLVAWDGKVWRVPQRLGPTDVDDPEHRKRAGVEAFDSVEAASAGLEVTAPTQPHPNQAPERQPPIRTVWWERTEKMTPFVDDISSPIFRNTETGEEASSRDLPAGSLYVKSRNPESEPYPARGSDGHSVACVLPGGHTWNIDSRASNCTKPEDDEHRCWVRHGSVGDRLQVDKNGNTCQAGGGSIDVPGWHGHLHEGELRQA